MRWLTALAALVAAGVPASTALADNTDACIAAAERAQRLRLAGKLRESRSELLTCARESCPGPVASDCKRWLADVQDALPSIVVHAVDGQGNDTTDVRLSIDGSPVASRLDGRPISADPGEHQLVAEGADGAGSVSVHFVLREGEHDHLVSVAFPREATQSSRVPFASWILGGVGIAALSAGTVLWVLGLNERADLIDQCGKQRVCFPGDETSAKTKLLAGDIAFGGGLVALGAAAWLVLFPARGATTAVDVHPVAGGAVVGYGATF